ncbi:YARHG domain-containing protein [Clostridium beijerinckii]|uniref:YARHG domain-containing protein n=1 Tax=Clostridium beijerinckii TaxID=1520 RepID=UPI001F3C8742|nr:YARHG domain-containing protein [Clostridium beijerinckii]
MKFCTKCGNPIEPNVKFCKKCGNPIKNLDIDNEDINKSEIDLSKKINNNVNNTIDFSKENINESITESITIPVNESLQKNENVEKERTMHINTRATEYEKFEHNNDTGNNSSKNGHKRSRKPFFSGMAPKIAAAVILIVAICIAVFFNRIEGEYYIMKANDTSISANEKFQYAVKAAKVLKSNTTKDLLKASIVEIAKNDVELAEEDLNQVSSMISQGDYQSIAIGIKDKKIDKLYKDGKYQDAVAEFSEIDKLGGNFKDNKNYEDIMLNVISKITNTPLANTKALLMEDRQICFDNFDDDPFDEIIELKGNGKYSYNSGYKLNLYKIKNGQYKLVDSFTMDHAWNQTMQGAYNYADNKKGVFIGYSNNSSNSGTSVFGVDNEKLQLKGTVLGNKDTKPDDVDNDGIYEIVSNSTSLVTSNNKDNTKWYKVYEDGRTPTEVNAGGGEKATQSSKSSNDYILKDSDKTYLMEDDLKNLTKDQLGLARNEIFARHGYVFTNDEYKKYFSSKSWYVPNPNYDGSDSTLNEYEIANYKVLQAWEQKK